MGRKLDALNAIAVEHGYTGDEPTSVVGAINAIVDAMGGDSNAVGVADAITALAPYIGGGGVDGGALVPVMQYPRTENEPVVGDPASLYQISDVAIIKIGNAIVADNTESGNGMPSDAGWASGVTLSTIWMPAYGDPTNDACYAFLYTTETVDESEVFKTITKLEDAVTMETDGNGMKRYVFTVPTVDEGTYFAVAYVGNFD